MVAPRFRTKQEEIEHLRNENRYLRKIGFGTNAGKVFVAGIKWGGFVAIAYFAKDVLISWAGKVTIADLSFKGRIEQNSITLKDEKKIDVTDCSDKSIETDWIAIFAVLVAILAIAYGRWQARLRGKVIQRLSNRQQKLEKVIDSKRTSSGITPTGMTRPEDK